MSIAAKSVRLFLVEGTPTGFRTAEIGNWTGHLVDAPRSKLPELLTRPEAARTGVYLLTGDDQEQTGKTRVYVGEGDSVIDRIKSHSKDASKDFWTHVCIVTSKDANLTKAHVRYLESRLVELAKKADRAVIANGNDPASKQLPESDLADMEFFIAQLQVVLPVIGIYFNRPKISSLNSNFLKDTEAGQKPAQTELILSSKKYNITAYCIENDGEFIILTGSQASVKDHATNQYSIIRENFIKDGTIIVKPDGSPYIFAKDATVKSPSAAAAIILNRNSNGRTEWRIKATGQTLKDWQVEQLAAVVPNMEG